MEEKPRELIELAVKIKELADEIHRISITANCKSYSYDIKCAAYKVWNQCHYVDR